jgi:hypothetical protein
MVFILHQEWEKYDPRKNEIWLMAVFRYSLTILPFNIFYFFIHNTVRSESHYAAVVFIKQVEVTFKSFL